MGPNRVSSSIDAAASVASSWLSSGAQIRGGAGRGGGSGGQIEAAGGRNLVVVVDCGPGLAETAGGAVRLVDDHQVPGGHAVVAVGGDHGGQGGVGGVGGDRPGRR